MTGGVVATAGGTEFTLASFAEVLSDELLPGINPRHDRHNRHVEQSSSEDRERDRVAQRPKGELGPRVPRPNPGHYPTSRLL